MYRKNSYKNLKKKIYRQYLIVKKLNIRVIKKKNIKIKLLRNWYLDWLKYRKEKSFLKKKYIWLFRNKKKRKIIKIRFGSFKKKKTIFISNSKERKQLLLLRWRKKLLISIKKKFLIFKKRKFKRVFSPFFKKKKNLKFLSKKKMSNKTYIRYNIKEKYFKNKIQSITIQLQLKLEKIISEYFHVSMMVKLSNFTTAFYNKKIFFSIFHIKKKKKSVSKPLFINYSLCSNVIKTNKFHVLNIDNVTNKERIGNVEKEKENFFLAKNNKIIGRSFYTLINYRKYFNAQLLADEISILLYKKKKHMTIFHTIKTLIDAFSETQIISYRITVNGKMNSKSRATNVTIVKGHIPAQKFLERINFGLSQAKTPTGTFGIRVYVYF